MDNVDKFNLWHWASTFYAHRVGNLSDTLKLSIFFCWFAWCVQFANANSNQIVWLNFSMEIGPIEYVNVDSWKCHSKVCRAHFHGRIWWKTATMKGPVILDANSSIFENVWNLRHELTHSNKHHPHIPQAQTHTHTHEQMCAQSKCGGFESITNDENDKNTQICHMIYVRFYGRRGNSKSSRYGFRIQLKSNYVLDSWVFGVYSFFFLLL